jgi:hypothetical protein
VDADVWYAVHTFNKIEGQTDPAFHIDLDYPQTKDAPRLLPLWCFGRRGVCTPS